MPPRSPRLRLVVEPRLENTTVLQLECGAFPVALLLFDGDRFSERRIELGQVGVDEAGALLARTVGAALPEWAMGFDGGPGTDEVWALLPRCGLPRALLIAEEVIRLTVAASVSASCGLVVAEKLHAPALDMASTLAACARTAVQQGKGAGRPGLGWCAGWGFWQYRSRSLKE